jgi:hypothetical protein
MVIGRRKLLGKRRRIQWQPNSETILHVCFGTCIKGARLARNSVAGPSASIAHDKSKSLRRYFSTPEDKAP